MNESDINSNSSVVMKTAPIHFMSRVFMRERRFRERRCGDIRHIRIIDDIKITSSRCKRYSSTVHQKRHEDRIRYFRKLFRKTSEKEFSQNSGLIERDDWRPSEAILEETSDTVSLTITSKQEAGNERQMSSAWR
jgi:hypothetical protein